MKNGLSIVFGLAICAVIIYGAYWVVKNVSYAIFYEDMVIETMREELKPECFKDYVEGLEQ